MFFLVSLSVYSSVNFLEAYLTPTQVCTHYLSKSFSDPTCVSHTSDMHKLCCGHPWHINTKFWDVEVEYPVTCSTITCIVTAKALQHIIDLMPKCCTLNLPNLLTTESCQRTKNLRDENDEQMDASCSIWQSCAQNALLAYDSDRGCAYINPYATKLNPICN
jgi:hypothetical protein